VVKLTKILLRNGQDVQLSYDMLVRTSLVLQVCVSLVAGQLSAGFEPLRERGGRILCYVRTVVRL